MLRLYKSFVESILVVLLHYKDIGYTLKQARTNASEQWYNQRNGAYSQEFSERIRVALRFLEQGGPRDSSSLDELIEILTKQLTSGKNLDRDLIDTIVNTIGLPYARTVLAGATLSKLRRAVLIPEEVADLKVALGREAFCMNCSHKFVDGEMTSFTGEHHLKGLICTRCVRPSHIASDNDISQSIPIIEIKGLYNVLMKKHLANATPSAPVVIVDEAVGFERGRDLLGAQGAEGAQNFILNAPPLPLNARANEGRVYVANWDNPPQQVPLPPMPPNLNPRRQR